MSEKNPVHYCTTYTKQHQRFQLGSIREEPLIPNPSPREGEGNLITRTEAEYQLVEQRVVVWPRYHLVLVAYSWGCHSDREQADCSSLLVHPEYRVQYSLEEDSPVW